MAIKKETAKKTSIRDINLEYGKVPPQSPELEEAVLGAMLEALISIPSVLRGKIRTMISTIQIKLTPLQ